MTEQKAGELPQSIDIGMELVLGELGSVVRVVDVDDEDTTVWVDGAGQQERSIFGIADDGSMPYPQALQLELAVDWDSGWETADCYGCGVDSAGARAETPEDAVWDFMWRQVGCASIEQLCPVLVRAYRVDDMAVSVSNFFLADMEQAHERPDAAHPRSAIQCISDFATAFAMEGVALGKLDVRAALKEAEELTERILSRRRELVAERSYSSEQVEQILRSRVAAQADKTSITLAL
jgi:hypothetical protein